MANFIDHVQTGFEVVSTQILVRQSHPHTILAEARWFDTQLSEQFQNGRESLSITLQFDDDKSIKPTDFVCAEIMEPETRINRQTLSHVSVDQSNARKTVFYAVQQTFRWIKEM